MVYKIAYRQRLKVVVFITYKIVLISGGCAPILDKYQTQNIVIHIGIWITKSILDNQYLSL